MSSSYADDSRTSDKTLDQNPGLKDDAVETGTSALDRAEDREVGLGSNPGITNKATTAMHQGMDQATGEQTPSSRVNAGKATEDKKDTGVGQQVKETVSGVLNKINENVKYS